MENLPKWMPLPVCTHAQWPLPARMRSGLPEQKTHSQDLLCGDLYGTLLVKTLQNYCVSTLGVEADGALWFPDCGVGEDKALLSVCPLL